MTLDERCQMAHEMAHRTMISLLCEPCKESDCAHNVSGICRYPEATGESPERDGQGNCLRRRR